MGFRRNGRILDATFKQPARPISQLFLQKEGYDNGSWAIISVAVVAAMGMSAAVAQSEAAEAPLSRPVFTRTEVAKHKTKENGIWVIYKDGVYDITRFVANHPGGRDKILMAAGGDIAPFWNIYRQHLNSPLASDLLKSMRIGNLHADDVAAMQAERTSHSGSVTNNPYSRDPILSPVMQFYQRQPINAEPPANLLGSQWITPQEVWFVRNHHPVPHLDPDHFQLEVALAADIDKSEGSLCSLRLPDLQRMPTSSVVSSIQCGGNRRMEMTNLEKTNGSSWNVSAISTAKWTGVKLRDVLMALGLTEDVVHGTAGHAPSPIKHVHFVSADGLEASIPIRKALDRFGDVLLAYEMNDGPLPPAHGYPLRVIVPGHVGVRNVKWVTKIRLSSEEAHGTWQRGMAYKGFGPSVRSLEGIDVEAIPSLQEQPVQSAITLGPGATAIAGEPFTIKGYAYSGGGRGIVRVDVSTDGGRTWRTADLLEGSEQPFDRSWAWTLWECTVPVAEEEAGKNLHVICKATDAAYNVQPDSVQGIWNLRGINNNAWHRITVPVIESQEEED